MTPQAAQTRSPSWGWIRQRALSLAAMVCLTFSAAAQADWQLDGDASRLNFISTKASHIAETHTFDGLSGTVTDQGQASISIDLSSVNTGIDIRNQRMQNLLFNVVAFPTAEITANIDMQQISVPSSQAMPISASLSLAGATTAVSAEVLVSATDNNAVTVTTLAPIVLNAADLELQPGIDALRDIAGLPAISYAVPVTFSLTFTR